MVLPFLFIFENLNIQISILVGLIICFGLYEKYGLFNYSKIELYYLVYLIYIISIIFTIFNAIIDYKGLRIFMSIVSIILILSLRKHMRNKPKKSKSQIKKEREWSKNAYNDAMSMIHNPDDETLENFG